MLLLFNQIALLSVNVDVTRSGQIGHRPFCNMVGADKRPREMLIKMAASAIKVTEEDRCRAAPIAVLQSQIGEGG